MTLEDLLGKLSGVRQDGKEWKALCPAHDDHDPSLGITEKDGKLLLVCRSQNCQTPDIVKALGLRMADLFTDAKAGSRIERDPKKKPSLVATFTYRDAEGAEVYQALRWEPGFHGEKKSFTQQRPDGRGGYIRDMKGVTKVLYRLPEVLEAVTEGRPVYLAEGEAKADVLASFGLAGTCNVGGAKKWQDSYTETLRGAEVFILPDNDDAGRGHLDKVGMALTDIAANVWVVSLPGLPPKGDIVDWVQSGGTREQFQALCEYAEAWTPTAAEQSTSTAGTAIPGSAPDGYPLTDLGNAERLVTAHGANLRFDVDAGQWLHWDGSRWASDSTGEVHRLAREVVREQYDLLKECGSDKEEEALFSHVRRSESSSRLDAMVHLARHCAGIPVQASDLDADPWLFNCANGTLDLRTGTLREHRQSDLLTKLSPVAYDAAATADRWERFLSEVFGEDEDLIGFVRRMCGYLLTGDTREQCFFLFTGKGSNGKSVLVNTLAHILGEYAKGTPVTTFLERRGENSSDLASLVGARLVTASEGEGVTSFNESLLKQLTGQDSITARHLYQSFFTFKPTFRVIFATNEVPRIRSQNYAMKRRVKLLPFRQRFYYPHEQQAPVRDEGLSDKLQAEASGILAWIMRGCLEWQKIGLGMPEVIQAEVDSLFEGMDLLLDFIESECELHPRLEVESGALWTAYLQWCELHKTKPAFKRANEFGRSLCGRDNIESKRTASARLLTGIGLTGSGENPPGNDDNDNKTGFSGNSSREAIAEKSSRKGELLSLSSLSRSADTEPDVFADGETGENPDTRPAIQGVSTPGKCAQCGGRSYGKVRGDLICYGCYERLYPAKTEVTKLNT